MVFPYRRVRPRMILVPLRGKRIWDKLDRGKKDNLRAQREKKNRLSAHLKKQV